MPTFQVKRGPQPSPVKYAVVCNCNTSEPVGWIDDCRPTGGSIRLRMASQHKNLMWMARSEPEEARWRDRTENAIRCRHCRRTAQFSEATAAAVCDELAANSGQLIALEVNGLDVPILSEKRYVVLLGVLCDRLSRFNR